MLCTNRILVVGDVHGAYLALKKILKKCNLSNDDLLIFLGDYVDGWSESPKVIDYLIELKESYQCIFLQGNHDELLLKWFLTKEDNPLWIKHGGQSTINAYKNIDNSTIEKHIHFLKNLTPYYVDERNRLFVHAGFTNPNGIEHEYFPKMYHWDRTLWETALALNENLSPDSLLYPKRLKLFEEIFIGHTPVTRINQTIPVNKANVWNIDTGAAFWGPLTIMDADTKEFWQSQPVCELYPNESGRN